MNDPPPPRRGDGRHTLAEREREAIAAARRRYEGSWLEHLTAHLKTVDFVNSVVLIGAALLLSVLPLLILLSSIANERIDDDLSRHIGLNSQGSHIVEHLFRHSPSHAAGPIILGLIIAFAGTLTVASSLRLIYERAFHQEHRGWRDLSRSSSGFLPCSRSWSRRALTTNPCDRRSGQWPEDFSASWW